MNAILSFIVSHPALISTFSTIVVNELIAYSKNLKPNSIGQLVIGIVKAAYNSLKQN